MVLFLALLGGLIIKESLEIISDVDCQLLDEFVVRFKKCSAQSVEPGYSLTAYLLHRSFNLTRSFRAVENARKLSFCFIVSSLG